MKLTKPSDPVEPAEKASDGRYSVRIQNGRHFLEPGHIEIPNVCGAFRINVESLGRLRPVAHAPLERTVRCLRCGWEIPVRERREHTPIRKGFEPYYWRALDGDLKALVEYYKQSTAFPDPGSAFYQCLGYLATTGYPEHTKVVRAILRINEMGGTIEKTPMREASYRYWYKTLLPAAKTLPKWIRARRADLRKSGEKQIRKTLWNVYVSQKLSKPHQGYLDIYHRGLKDIFFLLARTVPWTPTPAQATRKIACQIARISEGSVSRKNLRKK